MRCYDYNHVKKDCPKPDTFVICSNCSSPDHNYQNCHSALFKCITCSENHPTLASRCPTRRAMVKNKAKQLRDQSRVRSGTSYASATVSGQPQPQTQQAHYAAAQQGNTNLDKSVIITTALLQANLCDAAEPGSYQRVLDSIYRENGLTPVIIPKDAQMTTKIYQMLNGQTPIASTSGITAPTMPTTQEDNTTQPMNEEISRPNAKRIRDNNSDSDSDSQTETRPPKITARAPSDAGDAGSQDLDLNITDEETNDDQALPPRAQKEQPKKVGLRLYAPINASLPRVLTQNKIKDFLFKTSQVKYQYTEPCNPDDVKQMILQNKIPLLKTTIVPIQTDQFRKITSGSFFDLRLKK